jgi:hypothetical protein
LFNTADDQVIPLRSAVADLPARTVTLTPARPINVHHLFQLTAANPCPGGPVFVGVLNQKFSLGVDTPGVVATGRVPLGPRAARRA